MIGTTVFGLRSAVFAMRQSAVVVEAAHQLDEALEALARQDVRCGRVSAAAVAAVVPFLVCPLGCVRQRVCGNASSVVLQVLSQDDSHGFLVAVERL